MVNIKKNHRKTRFWPLLLGLIVLFPLFAFAQGKAVKVTDGDSVTVLTEEGRFISVRLYGVDAPEFRQAGGPEAADFTRSLVLFKEVELTVLSIDRYGRSVALVRLPDGHILNQELVAEGHAWVYGNYCKESICGDWKVLEKKAKARRKGIWKAHSPEAPWKWREENR